MFDFTSEQQQIRMAARTFAEGEFKDIARELDKEERFDDTLWKMATSLGFLGVFIDEEYEGPEWVILSNASSWKNFPEWTWGSPRHWMLVFFGTQLIQLVGTDEQKHKYLPDIYGGKVRTGMAITEPDAEATLPRPPPERSKRTENTYWMAVRSSFRTVTLPTFYCVV